MFFILTDGWEERCGLYFRKPVYPSILKSHLSPVIPCHTEIHLEENIANSSIWFSNISALDQCAKYFIGCMPQVRKERIQFSKTVELKRVLTFYRKGRRSHWDGRQLFPSNQLKSRNTFLHKDLTWKSHPLLLLTFHCWELTRMLPHTVSMETQVCILWIRSPCIQRYPRKVWRENTGDSVAERRWRQWISEGFSSLYPRNLDIVFTNISSPEQGSSSL